jgi:hypothetical protein
MVMLSVLLMGCAASAPPLPPDATSVNRVQSLALSSFTKEDAALSCDQIVAERQQIDLALVQNNEQIEGNRTRNQVAGYFGALFVIPLVAIDNNGAEKDEITQFYARRDILVKLGTVKGCG